MNRDDTRRSIAEIEDRWPEKFTDDELRVWATKLEPYELCDVVKALTEFKVTNVFPPKVPEITALLPKLAVPRTPPDGATILYRQQRERIRKDYDASKAEREAIAEFFKTRDARELSELKTEFLTTVEPHMLPLLQHREVLTSVFLKQGIYAMVSNRKVAKA